MNSPRGPFRFVFGRQQAGVLTSHFMRRLQAIAMVLVLAGAPLALCAGVWKCACAPGYCTMTHGFCDCPMMRHERQPDSKPVVCCNCMRYPLLAFLAPLEPMILPQVAHLPAVAPAVPEAPVVALVVLPGFLPSPFHPPRV